MFKKRFTLVPDSLDSLPGEATYILPDKQFVVIIQAPTPAGALRAESVTDTDECLIVNRGQGKRSYVDWSKIDGICTTEL
ncbi:MAG: hypothetical protein A2089_12565 [Elusimicrobia bacterium GWD2_63_28]|nr:MAG: hypothetical protein A2089_12565 [Elusimicrobia bacterium GWD2_63_28]